MKLYQLHQGDEFVTEEDGVTVYRVMPTDDQIFMAAGALTVRDNNTGVEALMDGETEVTLQNVA